MHGHTFPEGRYLFWKFPAGLFLKARRPFTQRSCAAMSLQSLPSAARLSAPELHVNAHGFSLHAAVRWRAEQGKELEQLCRYITRPAIANERLQRNRAGQVGERFGVDEGLVSRDRKGFGRGSRQSRRSESGSGISRR